jgi:hypothetical protein
MKDRKIRRRLSASLGILICLTLSLRAPAVNRRGGQQWIGTWASAPQPDAPNRAQTFRNQSLRLIVHTSLGGTKVRIKLSNIFGDQSLLIGGAHIARRTAEAEIDPASDRKSRTGFHDYSGTSDGRERSSGF